MHSTAVKFALKHKLNLGRFENGYYYLAGTVSMYPTAASAIVLMKRHLSK